MFRHLVLLAAVAAIAAASVDVRLIKCGKCSDTTCGKLHCLATDPYVCTAGLSEWGCAPTASTWENTTLCKACCDSSTCPKVTPAPLPPTPPSPACGKCTKAQCESAKRCSIAYPYQCTKGGSSGGCTANASYWPSDSSCSQCCDVATCEAPCAKKCSAEACKMNSCQPQFPYMCTDGPLKKGCAANASYWPDQSQCYDCCDTSNCAKPGPAPPISCSSKCSAADCANTNCSVLYPYMCTGGNSSGGCSASQSWREPYCSSCCDVSSCPSSAPKPGPTPPGPGPNPSPSKPCASTCPASVCQSETRCAFTAPFECTDGPGKGGCSAKADAWPASPICTACCDVKSCGKPCAKKCTAAQCKATTCNPVYPFYCTGGPDEGQCNANPDWFPSQGACYDCCDTSSCSQ